ncbi:RNA-directed DNA polymerase [Myxococcus faecalis]|uniref:RNA-directed DNA polymerase n=1 Tax=Myxococcus faecalis TaxID=3115646 RepID=UPI003CEDA992
MNSITESLLALGYFPKELPPCFSTEAFATWAKGAPAIAVPKAQTYLPVTHSLARVAGVRRTLSVPHPEAYLRLCKQLGDGWNEVTALLNQSNLSRSKPTKGKDPERAFVPELVPGDLARVRINNRRNRRYLLVADVAEFYRSIYTHSVPWVLHSKAVAKKRRRDDSLLGNRLDSSLMAGQDGQTNGIPVGPDASLIIGELVLSAIDAEMQRRLGSEVQGFRYYDDYEFAFVRRGAAEDALSHMQELLADYSLQLNPLKTRVLELPQRLETPWLTEFREFDFSRGTRASLQRIIRYFDRAFEVHNEHRDSYVLAYAISRTEGEKWSKKTDWPVVQDLLLQAVAVEMSATQQFVTALLVAQQRGYRLAKAAISDALNHVIRESAPAGLASETTWALWGLLTLKLNVNKSAAEALRQSQDVFVALLALDAKSQSMVSGVLETSQWESALSVEELHGERWLLAYEAALRGWLGGPSPYQQHINKDPFFNALLAAKVSFYAPVTGVEVSKETIRRLKKRQAQSYSSAAQDDAEQETSLAGEPEEYDPNRD